MVTNRQILLRIFALCSDVLEAAISEIPAAQLVWRPAPESRSIAEICRHVIRVSGWFLRQLGIEPESSDPAKDALPAIETALRALRGQIDGLVAAAESDADLRKEARGHEGLKAYSLDYAVKHISQHLLYHAAQIIYLRRAQDRAWAAPLQLWEETVDTISDFTWKA